jgi:CO/xanthine dehydrogenase Mo-binding subunit
MTGLLHEKEFSRKSFLRGTGVLVVSYGAIAGAANAATGNTPFNARGPGDYLPNLNAVDTWLAITPDNRVIVSHGEPEFAGTPTGILMLVAEELAGMKRTCCCPVCRWLHGCWRTSGSDCL